MAETLLVMVSRKTALLTMSSQVEGSPGREHD
jgi:hypothetical protein